MNNRVKVNISGRSYSLIVEDDEVYVRRVAAHAEKLLNAQKRVVMSSEMDAAVMALLNACDEYHKLTEETEALRRQAREEHDELITARFEIAELKRLLEEK